MADDYRLKNVNTDVVLAEFDLGIPAKINQVCHKRSLRYYAIKLKYLFIQQKHIAARPASAFTQYSTITSYFN